MSSYATTNVCLTDAITMFFFIILFFFRRCRQNVLIVNNLTSFTFIIEKNPFKDYSLPVAIYYRCNFSSGIANQQNKYIYLHYQLKLR